MSSKFIAWFLLAVMTFIANFLPAVVYERSVFDSSAIELPAISANKQLVQPNFNSAPINLPVAQIAQQVTVRILSNRSSGSGIIIAHQGQNYTVLTAKHVVAFNENRFTVLTADGMRHIAQWQNSVLFGDADLALVSFRSDRVYQIVEIGDSNSLAVGDPVYASGFPNWYRIEQNRFQNTRNWGLRAFRYTEGSVGMLLLRSMQKGYQMGYTNQIETGMSGGPVLNRDGKLVGINGRSKYPPRGIRAFVFADGTLPSRELFREMETLSWGIPITSFQSMNK